MNRDFTYEGALNDEIVQNSDAQEREQASVAESLPVLVPYVFVCSRICHSWCFGLH